MHPTKRQSKSRSCPATVLGAVVLCLGVSVAYGNQSGHESSDVKAARGYATAAVHADTVADAHTALQRTLNCLVGRSGRGYDKTVHDRCSTTGILAEYPRSTRTHIEAQKAAQIAEAGLSTSDLGMVHKTAGAVLGLLQGKGIKGEYD